MNFSSIVIQQAWRLGSLTGCSGKAKGKSKGGKDSKGEGKNKDQKGKSKGNDEASRVEARVGVK